MQPLAPSHVGPYTWDDFLELDEDDTRELIDGELVEVDVTSLPHERVVTVLSYFLEGWRRAGHGGMALASGYKVRISERRGVMPDVQYFRSDNPVPRSEHKGLVTGRPDLVVEVISPSSTRYDRVTKLNWYAGRGVPEYWLVDPLARTLERLVLRDGAYVIAASLAEDDVFRPETFADLAIPLRELWTDADT